MKTIVIIHRHKVIFRTEEYMKQNYQGLTLREQIQDLIENLQYLSQSPTIIVQGKQVEQIIHPQTKNKNK